jgi:hypothetical protein
MLNFLVSLYIFYTLLATSVLTAGILLVSYQRERQNLILRSCCLVVLVMYGAILAGHIHHQGLADRQGAFCQSQAIFLNYCYICIHAHACFMMLNNCYVAMGWKWKFFEHHVERESTLVLLSYTMPLLYVALLAFRMANVSESVGILPGPFFCSIAKPRLIMQTFWFILFSVPGSILSVYLLYKTWRARQRTLAYGNTTQLTLPYLIRLTISTFVYICLSYGSFVPLLIIADYDPDRLPLEYVPDSRLRTPWLNPSMCLARSDDIGIRYYATMLCPGALSYFPAYIGLAFFLMYGFGAHARSSYRHFVNKYIRQVKRRNSTLPLMDSAAGSTSLSTIPERERDSRISTSPIGASMTETTDDDGVALRLTSQSEEESTKDTGTEIETDAEPEKDIISLPNR